MRTQITPPPHPGICTYRLNTDICKLSANVVRLYNEIPRISVIRCIEDHLTLSAPAQYSRCLAQQVYVKCTADVPYDSTTDPCRIGS
jgi:hypothetical protein